MAISQSMVSSFKSEAMLAIHDLDTDTIKMALYTSIASLGPATTAYTTSEEVVGTNYVAGGNTLTSPVVSLDGTTGICDFADTTWASSTITARGALVYNASKANRAIAVLDFGSDKISTDGDFTIVMPAPTASTALIRIA